MLFNTFQFAVFFLAVMALHFALPPRWRGALLLAASYYFYMCWSVKYILVILAITGIDFYAGQKIAQATGARRRVYLALSIVCNFGLLFVFKYLDFFAGSFNTVFQHFNPFWQLPLLHLLLPVGISFHTFQAVSYTFDVYRGKAPAERSLLKYALYVAFFPQMVAGPIERPNNLLPQFHRGTRFDYARVKSGLRTALWGLIKKAVVADLASPAVTQVYGHPQSFSGVLLLLATALFAVQIYCDFSGYSDIAIGTARMLGYDLMINFRQPYFARSIGEFWQKWHISLSSWFRDYLYIPLGGNRVAAPRWYANILLVFLVSGLWHGASWTFVAWGALHGVYLIVGALHRKFTWLPRLPALGQVLVTDALVTVAWVFFRAQSLRDALYILTHLFRFGGFHLENLFSVGLPRFEMTFLFFAIATVFVVEYLRLHPPERGRALWRRRGWRWAIYAAGVYAVVFFGVFERVEFIYFQF